MQGIVAAISFCNPMTTCAKCCKVNSNYNEVDAIKNTNRNIVRTFRSNTPAYSNIDGEESHELRSQVAIMLSDKKEKTSTVIHQILTDVLNAPDLNEDLCDNDIMQVIEEMQLSTDFIKINNEDTKIICMNIVRFITLCCWLSQKNSEQGQNQLLNKELIQCQEFISHLSQITEETKKINTICIDFTKLTEELIEQITTDKTIEKTEKEALLKIFTALLAYLEKIKEAQENV